MIKIKKYATIYFDVDGGRRTFLQEELKPTGRWRQDNQGMEVELILKRRVKKSKSMSVSKFFFWTEQVTFEWMEDVEEPFWINESEIFFFDEIEGDCKA